MALRPPLRDLVFTEHAVHDQVSLALFWAGMETHSGIYWLDFADGYSYIGQSVSTRARLSAHRRRWADIIRVRFAPCPVEQLDELERAAIRHAEKTQQLRNKLLTNRPGGEGDVTVRILEGPSLPLPWERSRRGSITLATDISKATEAEKNKARALMRIPSYPALADAAAALIAGSLPSPAETQSVLWSVSVLPATNRGTGWRRLLTLSAGRLEILRVFEHCSRATITNPAFLNIASTERASLSRALRNAGLHPTAVTEGNYRSISGVQTLRAPDPAALGRLLNDPVILDSVYRLVITAMRQGSAPLGRFHNSALADDLLNRARRVSSVRHRKLPRSSAPRSGHN